MTSQDRTRLRVAAVYEVGALGQMSSAETHYTGKYLYYYHTLMCSTLLISQRCLDSVFESVPARFSIQLPA